MKLPDALDEMSTHGRSAHVYGQPYETADGSTIITVAKIRGKISLRKANPLESAGEDGAARVRPVGVFVIRGDEVKWEPAVDTTALAAIGALTGLVAATLATLAMVRRPPWPDLHGTI